MGEIRARKSNDRRYRTHHAMMDEITQAIPFEIDLKQSIKDMYRIYGQGMKPEQFAKWYGVRYGIRIPAVLAVMREQEGQGHV